MTETTFVWRGLAWRPWSPAHLRLTPGEGGDLAFHWIRRARLDGDGGGGGPPGAEEEEVSRRGIFEGGAGVRAAEIPVPAFTWTAAMQATDFPGGVPDPVVVRVAQGSARFGWGATTQRSLWR